MKAQVLLPKIFNFSFTYKTKKEKLTLGDIVEVPFGKEKVIGVVWPSEKISNEISATAGYEFNKKNSVLATSGNNKFKFDIKQQGFAWMTSNKKEKIMVKVMKKGSRIMISGYNEKGSQTIDHYSLLGFTKAYNTAKKACS